MNKEERTVMNVTLLCVLLIELEQVNARIHEDESKRNGGQNNSASYNTAGVLAHSSLGCAAFGNIDDRWLRIFVPTNLEYDGLRPYITRDMHVGCTGFGDRPFHRAGWHFVCFPLLEWTANE
jgi:hypothetical protein